MHGPAAGPGAAAGVVGGGVGGYGAVGSGAGAAAGGGFRLPAEYAFYREQAAKKLFPVVLQLLIDPATADVTSQQLLELKAHMGGLGLEQRDVLYRAAGADPRKCLRLTLALVYVAASNPAVPAVRAILGQLRSNQVFAAFQLAEQTGAGGAVAVVNGAPAGGMLVQEPLVLLLSCVLKRQQPEQPWASHLAAGTPASCEQLKLAAHGAAMLSMLLAADIAVPPGCAELLQRVKDGLVQQQQAATAVAAAPGAIPAGSITTGALSQLNHQMSGMQRGQ